jgi:hypothetical protein
MELFTINKTTHELFHGTNNPSNLNIIQKPMWFAHNEKDAQKYGKNILKFKLKKSLKLIDISNQIFHMDFIAKVNNEKSPHIDSTKFDPLIAIGLPDLKYQTEFIGIQKSGIYPNNNLSAQNRNTLNIIEQFSHLFGNKHRFSSQINPQTDAIFVEALQRLYPDFDGYICENYWPSYHHGGFLTPETCLFKPLDCSIKIRNYGGKSKNTKNKNEITGGSPDNTQTQKHIPGSRPNPYGGLYYNIEQFCKDTGIKFEDIIYVNHKIFED